MQAAYQQQRDGGAVHCLLCPTGCVIPDGAAGACRIRVNRGGVLEADAYGRVVTLAVDPIEKKPLYHFYPSRPILSTGANGCNFHCGFCQNHEISQRPIPTRPLMPDALAGLAGNEGSIGVAYTYTEPFVWFEYVRDAGGLVHDRGLVNVMVTNGHVNEAPLCEILPVIDAMNVDVKSMRPDFYADVCGGKVEDVLRTVAIAAAQCHVEVTNLVIPGFNDTDDDFNRLVDWLASVDDAIPLHFSAYFPRYRFTAPPTPVATLVRARDIARASLKYVYIGNVSVSGASDTTCPSCGALLVKRQNYTVTVPGIRDGVCASCGTRADFVGV